MVFREHPQQMFNIHGEGDDFFIPLTLLFHCWCLEWLSIQAGHQSYWNAWYDICNLSWLASMWFTLYGAFSFLKHLHVSSVSWGEIALELYRCGCWAQKDTGLSSRLGPRWRRGWFWPQSWGPRVYVGHLLIWLPLWVEYVLLLIRWDKGQ